VRPPVAQVYIKEGGTGHNAGKAFYTPPRGAGILEGKIHNLIEFLNDDGRYPIDPLLKMAIGHFQFEAIHTFRDGNGRTGRIFNINYLTKKELLDYPILYLSRYILENKAEYYARLSGGYTAGQLGYVVTLYTESSRGHGNMTYNKINDIVGAKDAILHFIEIETDFSRPDVLVDARVLYQRVHKRRKKLRLFSFKIRLKISHLLSSQ